MALISNEGTVATVFARLVTMTHLGARRPCGRSGSRVLLTSEASHSRSYKTSPTRCRAQLFRTQGVALSIGQQRDSRPYGVAVPSGLQPMKRHNQPDYLRRSRNVLVDSR